MEGRTERRMGWRLGGGAVGNLIEPRYFYTIYVGLANSFDDQFGES